METCNREAEEGHEGGAEQLLCVFPSLDQHPLMTTNTTCFLSFSSLCLSQKQAKMAGALVLSTPTRVGGARVSRRSPSKVGD